MQYLKHASLLPLIIFLPILAQGEVNQEATADCKKAILNIAEYDLDKRLCLFHPKVFYNSQALIDDINNINRLLNTAQAVCPADLTKKEFLRLESEHPQWQLQQIPFKERSTDTNVINFCNRLHP